MANTDSKISKQNNKSIPQIAETPYGTKISDMNSNGVEFYWKKPEFATAYEVFMSYEEYGNYEKIADIPKRSIGDFTFNDFDHDKRILFFKVRSIYVDNDGNKSVSEMSKPAKAEYLEHMELSLDRVIMYSGTTKHIHAKYGWGEPKNAKWESDNEQVATVDSNGTITSIAKGQCNISCTNLDNGETVYAVVLVDRDATEPLSEIKSRYVYDSNLGFWKSPQATKNNSAVITMAGDMMCSATQMRKQYSEAEGWNFNQSFKYVKQVFESSDLAIGNVETLLASSWPYMIDEAWIDNKNNCNAPARYLDAVKYAGFDLIAMANNHNCDGGVRALLDTIDQVEKYKFIMTGVFKKDDDPRYVIVDVNGIKVGIVSYMTAETTFNGKDKTWTDEEKQRHLNVFKYEEAARDITLCKKAGAEFVIAYMHWGNKNYRNITEGQRKRALEISNAGADLIIGSNPHLVQIYDEIKSKDGRNVPCYYSIGNFQATMNQVDGNRESVIVKIELQKSKSGKVVIKANEAIPCYCYTRIDDALWCTVPLPKEYNESPKSGISRIRNVNAALGNKPEKAATGNKKQNTKRGLKRKIKSFIRNLFGTKNETNKTSQQLSIGRSAIWKAMDVCGWNAYEAYSNLFDMAKLGMFETKQDITRANFKRYNARLSREMLNNEVRDKATPELSKKEFENWFYKEKQKKVIEEIRGGKITYSSLCNFMNLKIPKELADDNTNIAPLIRTRSNTLTNGDIFVMYSDKEVSVELLQRTKPALVICRPKYESVVKESGVRYITKYHLRGYICEISRIWREVMDVKTVSITGTVGKTTTTEMIGCVVCDAFDTYKIKNNQNTEKQIPGLIYNLRDHHTAYVQEAAGSYPSQLETSSKVLEPDVFVITNIGTGHIGNYDGNREMLLYEKLSLERHSATDAIGVLNGDDDLLRRSKYTHKITWYSMKDPNADFFATNIVEKDGKIAFDVVERDGLTTSVTINVCGIHNVYNALSAFGVGVALGIDRNNIVKSLQSYASSGMRQNYVRYGGRRLYFDCYSITTESVISCIHAMRSISTGEGGHRILVIGDIIQPLGDQVERIHRNIGKILAEDNGLDEVFMFGKDIKFAYEEATKLGKKCRYTDNLSELEKWIIKETDERDLVGFKANHFSRFQWTIDNICGTDHYFFDELCNTMPLEVLDGITYKLVDGYGAGIVSAEIRQNKELIIPESVNGLPVRTTGGARFASAEALESITLPDSLLCISSRCFDGCKKLNTVKFGKSLKYIGQESFSGCTSLETIDLSDTSLETIDSLAFKNCPNLKNIILPKTIKWISDSAFDQKITY